MARIFAIICAVLVAATAHAQAPSAQAVKAAKQHYVEGKKFQDAGNYDAAIVEYEAAYKLAPRPQLEFNIGQCYRLKGDKQKAIDAYEAFLAAAPDDPVADEAREHVATLKLRIEVERAEAASKQAAAEAELARKQAAEAEAARTRAEAEAAERQKRIAAEDEARRKQLAAAVESENQRAAAAAAEHKRKEAEARNVGRIPRYVGVGLVCAGVLVAVSSLLVAAGNDSAKSTIDNTMGQWTTAADQAQAQLVTDSNTIKALWGVGGGLVLAGSVTAIVGAVMRSRAVDRVRGEAWLAPSGGGIAVAGRF